MFGEDQVLKTKLMPPRGRRHTLVRRRLQERLAEAFDVPLTILQAGPGYGKTTAIAGFVAEQPCVTAWYAIGEEDLHPLPFLLHLIHALRMQNPLLGDKALSILQEGQGADRPWELALAALINDMVVSSRTAETLIVLDDFHLVDESPAVVSLVEHLVEQLPPEAHLLLATRRRPPLAGLPKWRARAEVLELGEEDLAFTPAEVEALFRDQYGFDLTEHQAGGLTDRTEGWIMALQLIWQSLRKGSSLLQGWELLPDRLEALFIYLAQEVLDRQKPFVRRFLLATSVLEELQPAVCDALMGEPGSEHVLAALEENGLFTQAMGGGVWRYHQLFHQFLKEQAEQEPERCQQYHLVAAKHYQAAGEMAEAAPHFLAASEYEEAARCIRLASGLLESGRVDVLGGLLERLPDETYQRYPDLLLRRGDVARLTSRFDEALLHYEASADIYRIAVDRRGLCLALQGQGRVYLDTIQPGEAEGFFQEALELADALTDEERAQLMALVAENATNSGRPADAAHFAQLAAARQPVAEDLEVRTQLRTGRLAAAMGLLERLSRQGLEGASRSHREVPLLISLIAAMTGEAERARVAAEEGIRVGREKRSPFVEGVGFIRLGHALQLDSLTPLPEAAAQYQQAIGVMDRLKVVRGKAEPLAGLCALHGHVGGDWGTAERYGREGAAIAEAARDHWFHAFCLLSLGGSAVATGRSEAERYLHESADAFQAAGDPHGLALVRMWQALLAFRLADWDRFDTVAAEALDGAQFGGYGFIFTRRTLFGPRDPQVLIPVLSEAVKRSVRPDYAAWLLAERGIPNPENHPGFTLRLRTLGDFQVWRGSQEVTRREWQREKARQLLQLLITFRRRTLQREQILDLLWPGLDTETAARDFKVALNALVTALEPNRAARSGSFYILRNGQAYGINPGAGLWLDADEFERLATEGLERGERGERGETAEAAATLRRALDLYQGDYLQDAPYEDWCTEERERLQVLYLRSAEWLAGQAAGEGEYEVCIRMCDRILARDQCWEEAYRLLMQSHYRMGNRAMALRTYDRCVQNLEAELGVGPMPATVQLYERIRRSV